MVRTVLLLCALAVSACGSERGPVVEDAERLHGAVHRVTEVMTHDIFSPPQAARVYAYVSVAAYEAVAATRDELASLGPQLADFEAPPAPDPAVDGPAAAVFAALAVGEALTFQGGAATVADYRADAEAQFRASLGRRGLAAARVYGEAVAEHVLAWAATDGYAETRSGPAYTVTGEPGTWQPTPPAYMDGIEPNWASLRPFVLDSAAQFKPPPPPPYSVEPGAPFRAEVDAVVRATTDMTDEERAIASFWDCNPYVMHTRGHAMFATKKLTPGGHWMGIAAIASRTRDDDTAAAAETYARTALALADGFISVWDEKYRSRLVRPETVINAHVDEGWAPLLQTPPFPEYSSGHSVISAAAAEALTAIYGDAFAFDDTTEVAYGLPVRSFASFREAAEEAAQSRVYGGIHYPMAAEHGLTQGRLVGALHIDRLRTRTAPRPLDVASRQPDGASAPRPSP